MIVIVHSIYSQSVHSLALNAGLMDNDAERYCINTYTLDKSLYIRDFRIFIYREVKYCLSS